jgi:hypothetical protein
MGSNKSQSLPYTKGRALVVDSGRKTGTDATRTRFSSLDEKTTEIIFRIIVYYLEFGFSLVGYQLVYHCFQKYNFFAGLQISSPNCASQLIRKSKFRGPCLQWFTNLIVKLNQQIHSRTPRFVFIARVLVSFHARS